MAWPFSWATQTITRIRPGTKTVRGSEIRDWDSTNVSEKDITGCSMQPAGNTLSQDGRVLGVFDGYTCYAPIDADIQAGDRIKFNGQVYEINGEPNLWTSATGNLNNMLLNLVRWSG